MRVSVIGASEPTDEQYELARRVGGELAARGHTVVCGGLTGVMDAVCLGASESGGQSIGIVPGADRGDANRYVDVAIATGLGDARNALVVMNGDAAIAVGGSYGTLSEIAFALNRGVPVASLDSHDVDGVEVVDTPEAAVEYVEAETA